MARGLNCSRSQVSPVHVSGSQSARAHRVSAARLILGASIIVMVCWRDGEKGVAPAKGEQALRWTLHWTSPLASCCLSGFGILELRPVPGWGAPVGVNGVPGVRPTNSAGRDIAILPCLLPVIVPTYAAKDNITVPAVGHDDKVLRGTFDVSAKARPVSAPAAEGTLKPHAGKEAWAFLFQPLCFSRRRPKNIHPPNTIRNIAHPFQDPPDAVDHNAVRVAAVFPPSWTTAPRFESWPRFWSLLLLLSLQAKGSREHIFSFAVPSLPADPNTLGNAAGCFSSRRLSPTARSGRGKHARPVLRTARTEVGRVVNWTNWATGVRFVVVARNV